MIDDIDYDNIPVRRITKIKDAILWSRRRRMTAARASLDDAVDHLAQAMMTSDQDDCDEYLEDAWTSVQDAREFLR